MDHSCCHEAAANVASPFLQLLSLGFIWVFLHCAPMCGPIVLGLNLGKEVHPALGIGLYQLGRGLIYAVAGAFAGAFGSSFQVVPQMGWVVVAVMGLLLFYQAFPHFFGSGDRAAHWLIKISSLGSRMSGPLRPLVFGMIFAFLPCMLTAWVLTLAASTQSPWQGSAVMSLLVVMTTLPLLSVSWGLSNLFRGRQKQVSLLLLGLSFIWTILVTAAANHLIPHLHLEVPVFGESYKLMLW